jgi:hypothetical protein
MYCKCQYGACKVMLSCETEIFTECNEKEKRGDTVKHVRTGHLSLHLKLSNLCRLPSFGKQLPQ